MSLAVVHGEETLVVAHLDFDDLLVGGFVDREYLYFGDVRNGIGSLNECEVFLRQHEFSPCPSPVFVELAVFF